MMGFTACETCRLIRRFLLAFGLGVLVMWQFTGKLPFDPDSTAVLRAMLGVVIIIAGINLYIRMKQIRARFRR
jgi:disulfide bond formation protein DsbB